LESMALVIMLNFIPKKTSTLADHWASTLVPFI
jgi:hypothetical protein